MAHSLILGITESGKTTLAKKLAEIYRKNGIKVIVLDPLGDPEWPCDFITSDVGEFLNVYWDSTRCAVFVDEASETCGQHDKSMIKTATRGRHLGHNNHYISQRGMSIARTARDQCTNIFLFGTSLADSKDHANEWNCPELINAPNLPQGHYYSKARFGPVSKRRLF